MVAKNYANGSLSLLQDDTISVMQLFFYTICRTGNSWKIRCSVIHIRLSKDAFGGLD
jgi:hypothetical protein